VWGRVTRQHTGRLAGGGSCRLGGLARWVALPRPFAQSCPNTKSGVLLRPSLQGQQLPSFGWWAAAMTNLAAGLLKKILKLFWS